MDEDDVIPGSIIPGGEVRGDFENFANTVKILEYLAAGFNPLGPSGTANQEFKTVRAYLQNIYGPLPEGAVDYASGDLNGDGVNEVYAVDANGDPHTIYSYGDNNEVVSTSYEDFATAPNDLEKIREILSGAGYSDEVIEEIFNAEVNNTNFQGNNVLSNILCDLGYINCSDFSVNPVKSTGPAVGSECTDENQREGTIDESGDCQFTTGGGCLKGSVPGTTDASGECIPDDSGGDGTGDYSEEEKSIAESIKDWVEGKIGEVKDMTAEDVLEAVFGSGGYTCELTGEGEEPWDCAGTDGTDGNQCWKDCVSASVLGGIPGLPMPPGAVDIGTVRDLENTANDIGTTIGNILDPDTDDEGFIQQVKDWVTGKIDGIFGNTDDVTLEQITGWITGKLGNVLGSLILIETADATNTVTTKINEILGLPLTDPEDENCIETEYFEANKEKCTELGYVDCDGALGEQGQELTGGIIGPNETTQGCSEIQNPDTDTTKCTEGSPDNDGNCICSDGTPEDEDGNCLDDTPLTPEQICEEKGLTYDPSDLNADPDGCVRGDPEVTPEQICENKGLTHNPTAPEEDRDEDDCVSTVISDPKCNDPNAKNYNELGECGECESGFSKDPDTKKCKPDGPTLDCTTITSENAAGCKKKDCGGGVFVDEGEDCPTTVNPCINGEEPHPQKGCPEDWCDEAMTIAPDENGQCPSDPPLVECPDGTMVANEKDCYKDTLIECPVKSDRPGTMVKNIEDCYDSVTLIECPEGTPNAGQMVDDKSKCGTTTTYTCPDPNATTNEDGSCGPCKTGYVYDGAVERCVQSTTPDPCLDAAYAEANPEQCGTGGDCDDCTCAEYAAANPEECATSPETPSGGSSGGGGMFRPQAGVPPTLGDPQLLARMEFPITNFLEGMFKDYV